MWFLYALIFSICNRYAGMTSGNRYVPSVVLGVFTGLATWDWTYGLCATVGFLVWRSIGWYNSIDMGRNEGTPLRDAFILGLISVAYGLPFVFYGSHWSFPLACAGAVVMSYGFAMWFLPWTPKVKHIAVAEAISGALLGLLTWTNY